MMDEKTYVISAFEQNFEKYRNENIVIYGLGKNTKVVLDAFADYKIVGLMDQVRTGDTVWGLPVIDCDTAFKMEVKLIVIIARAANVPVIYHRIAKACRKYGISVCDIGGNDVSRKSYLNYHCPERYAGLTRDALKKKILECDVVSFDIFDTLLMRTTLYPTDVFYNMSLNSKEVPEDFAKNRIQCERELYLSGTPEWDEIYARMVETGAISVDVTEQLMALELEEEERSITARKTMLELVSFAKLNGKNICCTSDMYLPKEVLKCLLQKNGYPEFEEIFVSCEYRTAKCEGLYQVVRDQYPGKKMLHIGDNYEVDIVSAQKYGVDEVFYIPSAAQMLADSAVGQLLDEAEGLQDRNAIGSFIAAQLNDPFLFADTKGKLQVNSCFELGYHFIEPLLSAFLKWMLETMEKEKLEVLLLGARDGWLIKQLLDILKERSQISFSYEYFYTSRFVCTMAGMHTEEDILYAAYNTAFAGSTEEMLINRFGIKEEEILARMEGESEEDFLLRHTSLILEQSQEYRRRYKEYLNSIPINMEGKKIGFFDFVASGTCQMWLEKIVPWDLQGLYTIRYDDKKKEHLAIHSLFHNKSIYVNESKLYLNYYYMETILTSPEPTFRYLDENGAFVFEKEVRSEEKLSELKKIHEGVLAGFIDRWNKDQFDSVSLSTADTIFDFIRGRKRVLDCHVDYFDGMELEDAFCNRSYCLMDEEADDE